MKFLATFLLLLFCAAPMLADSVQADSLVAATKTVEALKAENELLQIRSNVNFLSAVIILSVVMIFFMWGIRERNRKHVMLLQRKNYALQKANEEAEEARELAERESNMKSIFLKNLSHEIRTPLNQIYGFAQLLTDESIPLSDEEKEEMMKVILDSSSHMTRIVDNASEVTEKLSGLTKLQEAESVLKDISND